MRADRNAPCILSIEDSIEDFEVIRRSLRRVAPDVTLVQCKNGDAALEWLHADGNGRSDGHSLPQLILLDLNLPGKDGRDVLKLIKADPRLRAIPVVVLSTSVNEHDVDAAYENGANAYLTKPEGTEGFDGIAQVVNKFWLESAMLPHAHPPPPWAQLRGMH